MVTVKERKTTPFQVISLSTLFLISVLGYITFNTWHDNKHKTQTLTSSLNNNTQYAFNNTQTTTKLNSSFSAHNVVASPVNSQQ